MRTGKKKTKRAYKKKERFPELRVISIDGHILLYELNVKNIGIR